VSDKLSYPKKKIQIVLAEKVHASAAASFREAGYDVETLPHALDEAQVADVISRAHILGVRSRTQVRAAHLAAAKRLLAIGCFTVGTDQVDLEAATRCGIPVFNAPYSSTRSVAELTLCNVIALARKLTDRSMRMHQGKWDKSVEGSVEVRDKTLGIIGYGHIGQQVGLLGETLGLNVLFYDVERKLPLGRARSVGRMLDVLEASDFVTLHVPGGPSTRLLIGPSELASMKRGSHLLNLSRGSVVDIEALKHALESKHLAGAAIDVYPEEPVEGKAAFTSPLQLLDNVILTPHVGGSTEEAQRNIGHEVASALVSFLDSGNSQGSVNFPTVHLPPLPRTHRILITHRNVPGALSEINRVLFETGANVEAQVLSTHGDIGYLITDINKEVSAEVKQRIQELPQSVRTRVLH
jgi:D-3-phosphoglycerate dehydrogenase